MSFITSFGDRLFIGSGDLLRTCRIGDETEPTTFIHWNELNPERIQKPDFDVEKDLKTVEKRVILCIAHSNFLTSHGRRMVAVGTNEKQIHVFEYFVDHNGVLVKCEHIVTSVVPKAPTALTFDREDAYVVVGDRAGDIHRFSVLNGSAIEMAGAISMVLDVAFTPDGKRLLMADRDEKVRAIRYPSTYVIDAFCLGHTEYVKTLAVQNNDSIWSAGGDKMLYNWSIIECSKPLRTVDLSEVNGPIRKISINLQQQKLAILFDNVETIVIVDIGKEPTQSVSVNVSNESQFHDITSTGNHFVVLGRSTVTLIDLITMSQTIHPIDNELIESLKQTNDAVDNLFKNVTHNNQQEYEKGKPKSLRQLNRSAGSSTTTHRLLRRLLPLEPFLLSFLLFYCYIC
uniref:tRNA (guanine-N(7)-)-methyltransferase non-catalytic subunit n=1 Tax=Caenorhabditis tropicalis TaxID=1561998 RepID=A0A1I7U3H2_9PELO